MSGDGASCAINHLISALVEAFSSESSNPPDGGGISGPSDVRVFAGDGIPLAAWDSHSDGGDCRAPFIWVRQIRRYRTRAFPTPFVGPSPCGDPVAVAFEVGVGRCAVVDAEPTWDQYATEAEVSMDDAWRIELALCRAASKATSDDCVTMTAIDAVVPYGPEGGVVAQVGTLFVQL